MATRTKRITVTVNEEIYDAIRESAEYAGVSVNAYCAITLGQSARAANDARKMMMARAMETIDVTFGPEAAAQYEQLLLKAARGDTDEES